jgi:hypothetical protein
MATEDPLASIRDELRRALAAYSAETARMRNMRPSEDRQAALDAARVRFERAMEQYAKDVLGDIVRPVLA